MALNGYRYGVSGAVVTTDGVHVSMQLNLALVYQQRFDEWMRGQTTSSATPDYGNFAFGSEADSASETKTAADR